MSQSGERPSYASMNDLVHASRHVNLPLALLAVFLMECLIALHTLWPDYPYLMNLAESTNDHA